MCCIMTLLIGVTAYVSSSSGTAGYCLSSSINSTLHTTLFLYLFFLLLNWLLKGSAHCPRIIEKDLLHIKLDACV